MRAARAAINASFPSTADSTASKTPSDHLKIEDAGPARKRLTITIPPEVIKQKITESMQTLSSETTLPGFRKGHVPNQLLERRFGTALRNETKNQIIAGFMAFNLFVFLYLIEFAESWGGWAASVVPYLSVSRHLAGFAKGVLDTRDIVYYLSFIGFGLFLTKQSIESYRWRG